MKILAIEDNPADIEILHELLEYPEPSSFVLVNARALAEAEVLLSGSHDIELVLLDLGLPDSQGIDTLRKVRSVSPSLPILVLTGFDDEETGIHALQEGAQDYLVKGQITGSALIRSIRYANERNIIEQELMRKNDALDALNEELFSANEELSAMQEELKKKVDELGEHEKCLTRNEEKLKQALGEKEVLLSEIHHRVKNNLTAFIALLSLEGSYETNDYGRALKIDLQNRARSMALIHETLYRTRQFSNVDMNVYLSTLVNQIISSFSSDKTFRVIVDGGRIKMNLARSTPCGLIINELITNSMKYAFPESGCQPDNKEKCTIEVHLTEEGGKYVLRVSDNGVGFPPGFDYDNSDTLGLKLVVFLAHHQLQASIEPAPGPGVGFIFRFSGDLDQGN